MDKNFVARIMADVNKFMANIARAQAAADKLQDDVTVNVDLDIGAATAQMSRFRAMMKSIPNKFRVRADVDAAGAVAKITALKALIKKGQDKIDLKLNIDTSNLGIVQRAFAQTGEAANQLGNKIGTLPALLAALAPAAIPIAASIVPAVMALGNAIAVVGGGAIGLAGAFSIAQAGVMAFGAMAASAYKMLQDGVLQATKETQAFQTTLASLKTQWQGLIAGNQAGIFTTMTNGINIAKAALSGLTPFMTGVVNSMAQMSGAVLRFVQTSPIMQSFFNMMNTTGVSVFNNILSAAGKFGAGFIAIITQFGPLFGWMAQGLSNMATQFQAWATSISTSNGIQAFIDYTKANLPVIGSIFTNVFTGIFNLFKAFAGNSQTIFSALDQMSANFATWSATVGQSQGFRQFIDYVQTQGPVIISTIGSIVSAIVAFATAMAPVGAAVLGVVSSIAQWVASFAQAHPQITIVIGSILAFTGAALKIVPIVMQVISGIMNFVNVLKNIFNAVKLASTAFTLLSNPVGIAIVAIGLIVAAIVIAYNKFEWFRNAINAIGQVFVWLGQQWMSGMSLIGGYIIQFVTGVWNILSNFASQIGTVLSGAWNGLVAVVQTVWTAISTAVTTGVQFVLTGLSAFGGLILSIFTAAWNGLVTVVTTVWTAITTAVTTGIQMIIAGITGFGAMVTAVFSAAWTGLLTIVTTVWTAISTAVMTGIQLVIAGITTFGASVSAIFSAAWQGLVAIVTTVWSAITSAISAAVSTVMSVVSSGFSAVVSTVSSIMSSVVSAVSSAWSAVTSAISSAISSVVSAVSSGFSNMLSVASSVMSSIGSAISSAWSAITSTISSAISSAVSAVSSGFSNMISAVTSFASNLISSITSAMSSFISAVTNGASQALSAIQNGLSQMISAITGFVGNMASAGADLVRGFINGITGMIGDAVAAAGRMASAAVDKVKSFLHIGSPSKVLKQIGKWMTQGFALGIEKDIPKVASATQRMLKPVSKGIAQLKSKDYKKAKDGASAVYGFMTKNMEEATKKLKAAAKKRDSVQKQINTATARAAKARTWQARNKEIQKIAKLGVQYSKLSKVMKQQAKIKAVNKNLKAEIRPAVIYMERIAKKREEIADRLKKAQDKLKDAIAIKADFKKAIKDNLMSFGSIANSKATTGAGLVSDLQDRMKVIKDYTSNINKLAKKGVDKSIIKQLIEAGVDGGAEQAKVLANASSDIINQVNYLQKQITNSASGFANKQSSAFYDAGINAAKGVIQGLQSQDKLLKTAANKIADLISTTVKKRLAIHSPSRVMMELGGYVTAGLANGILDNKRAVASAMTTLSNTITDSGLNDVQLSPLTVNGENGNASLTTDTNIKEEMQAEISKPKQPAVVQFKLGNKQFEGFVEDITDSQRATINLKEIYL